ncbi:ester cyclase [Solimonas sp. K1W22B-7]|uniref:ester cyclase n=1 Tax=Solimonas sp. K1W22B-7 TaxID=2303331 RepID=UPI000E32F395|nr:ester cyclase [Solimonas sp. K1W22B-7]AXQ31465.1 ester cyclase [Solimonas sp. K1W22B-7]
MNSPKIRRFPILAAAALLVAGLCDVAHARDNRKEAALWYEAFSKHDAELLGSVLSEDWHETPSEEPVGRAAGMKLLRWLTTVFPDFHIEIRDVIQEGNKVVVRSQITGTQAQTFAGIPSKNRRISIQAIDIHEFKDGKIVHTWHSEDWMTGLRQLGAFD